ncbi:MAG: hypothetical protein M1826_004770 [Phylliscum demangeonii]|nr:MAG: hypothetical protein M1826_004770 [Phylliscum demangeonii]
MRRTNESAMDFEWQGQAPGDPTSPFHQHTVNYHRKRQEEQRLLLQKQQQQQQQDQPDPTPPFGLFHSAALPQQAAAPPAQPFPAAYARQHAPFATPRKLEPDLDSSGVSSPENTMAAAAAAAGTESEGPAERSPMMARPSASQPRAAKPHHHHHRHNHRRSPPSRHSLLAGIYRRLQVRSSPTGSRTELVVRKRRRRGDGAGEHRLVRRRSSPDEEGEMETDDMDEDDEDDEDDSMPDYSEDDRRPSTGAWMQTARHNSRHLVADRHHHHSSSQPRRRHHGPARSRSHSRSRGRVRSHQHQQPHHPGRLRRAGHETATTTTTTSTATPPAARTWLSWLHPAAEWIAAHPDFPTTLSYWTQLLFNSLLLLAVLYLLHAAWRTIQADIDQQAAAALADAAADMAACARQFVDNRCDPAAQRVPAMEAVCDTWARCMNHPPPSAARGRAHLSAHTIAHMYNAFCDALSLKTMLFSLLFFCVLVVSSNLGFGMYRTARAEAVEAPPAVPGPGALVGPLGPGAAERADGDGGGGYGYGYAAYGAYPGYGRERARGV